LDRAKIDLLTSKTMMGLQDADELTLDVAAYHVQQAIEKCIEFHIFWNRR